MEYAVIDSPEALAPYLPTLQQAKVIAVDLETTGLDPHLHRIRLIQLAIDDAPALLLDADTFLPGGISLLRELLTTKAVKVMQNAKFDLQFLVALDIHPAPLFDTMLAARLLYMPGMPHRVSLEILADYYLGVTLDKTEQKGDWSGPLTGAQLAYAARDAETLLRLRRAMLPHLVSGGLTKIAEIEFTCVRAIAKIEYRGIHLDVPQWQALLDETIVERNSALEQLYAFTGPPVAQTTLFGDEQVLGFNFDSNPFVLDLLHAHGIPATATSKGDLYPFREAPLVQAITRYRKASKAITAILEPTLAYVHPITGRIHPHYGQISAYSGRMSCAGPNIQQIPRGKAYRACFTAPPGRRLVIADYSQIELRVAAQMSGDARMLEAYGRGDDLHQLTASLITGKAMPDVTRQERQAAKAVGFGLIYGMGAQGLMQYAGQSYGVSMTLDEATRFRKRFFEAYPGIAVWHQRVKENPPREGRTLTGRRFPISQQPSLPELSNAPVQGTGADILKKALGMLVDRLAGLDTHIVATVHDEILLECPQAQAETVAALLRDTMEAAEAAILPGIRPEADAGICESWAEK